MTRLLTAILCAIIFCSCDSITGSGNIITQTRNVNQFDGVKASGSVDVEVVNDKSRSVKVEADDNILPYVITKVEDGMLNIYLKHNHSYTDVNVKVYVSAPLLTRLHVSGSGSIMSNDTLKNTDQMELKVSGSGNMDAFIDAPLITAAVSGSGTLKVEGRTKDFKCTVSGSGDLNCQELLSENTSVNVSGSGNAHVFASVSLDAKVSGSGDIYYRGNPPSPQIRKSGSGSVKAE